jgi:putative transcriptional regulator
VTHNITAGSVLLASTQLDGSAWHRTLVMPVSLNSKRIIGVIINQISTVGIDILGFDLPYDYENSPVYLGGPVNPREIRLLHTTDWQTEKTEVFYNKVAVTNDNSAIDLFKIHQVPEYYRFVAGCVWWTPERLDRELDQKLWIQVSMNNTSIFAVPAPEQWDFVVNELSRNAVDRFF